MKVKIKDIKANPNNPRVIRDEQFKKLVKSIQEFPEMLSVRKLVCTPDMIVLGGNMRLKALQSAGIKEVDVEIVDWDEPKQKEFIIKDNVSFGEWNHEQLANEWDAIELQEWGLELPVNVDVETLEAVDDEYEMPDAIHSDVVLGDLIEIGEHRLLCGDSTDSDAVAKLMNGKHAELLFTSPPYSDMRTYNGNKDLSIDHISEFIPTYYEYAEYQVVNLGIQRKDNDIIQYWDDYINNARACGYKFLAWNVWKKSTVSVGQQSAFIPIYHEWIFVFGKEFKHINRTWERSSENRTHKRKVRQADGSMKESSIGFQGVNKEMESVFFSHVEKGEVLAHHPATFPIELPAEYIKAITDERDIVIEPFCGSGTTMVASQQLNRVCYGMELDTKYCQVIIDRMMKAFPELPVKINGKAYKK